MINTTLCYIQKDGAYLMLHRVKKQGDINRDKWIGLGGKLERGESPEEGVCREVLEESGLTLTDYRYRGLVTFVSDCCDPEYMHLFTADGFVGEVGECDEGDLQWVPIDRVRSLTLWEGDRLFLDLLQGDHPFFSLKLVYEGDRLASAALDGNPLDISSQKCEKAR